MNRNGHASAAGANGIETMDSLNYSDFDDTTNSYLQAQSQHQQQLLLQQQQQQQQMHDDGSLATAQHFQQQHYQQEEYLQPNDATSVVHEMHLALLYLLSNPEEFQRALAARPSRGATTLHEWNAEYEDNESLADTNVTDSYSLSGPETSQSNNNYNNQQNQNMISNNNNTTPLPFVVFADDAEVVLPAAFSASQLFGLEKVTGMELEAAAGLPALSQLFLRWLALMPGGDHLNLIDPPGLTVMRIAGGRYRVTAAHRVVWTWMNEFPEITASATEGLAYSLDDDYYNNDEELAGHADSPSSTGRSSSSKTDFSKDEPLRPGDLVTLTIVDVFETDNQGKLLSYCPTFDNRAVTRTNAPTETLRKSTAHLVKIIGKAQKSVLARKISFHATKMAVALTKKVEEAVQQHNTTTPSRATPKPPTKNTSTTTKHNNTIHNIISNQSPMRTREEKKHDESYSPARQRDIVSQQRIVPPSSFSTEDLEGHEI